MDGFFWFQVFSEAGVYKKCNRFSEAGQGEESSFVIKSDSSCSGFDFVFCF